MTVIDGGTGTICVIDIDSDRTHDMSGIRIVTVCNFLHQNCYHLLVYNSSCRGYTNTGNLFEGHNENRV